MDYEQIKKDFKTKVGMDIEEVLFLNYDYSTTPSLNDEDKARLDALWEKMKEACKDHDFVVIGANGGPIGLSTSGLEAYKEAERLRAQYTIELNASVDKMMKPAFLDESKSKLRTGKGHYKLKKGKKK